MSRPVLRRTTLRVTVAVEAKRGHDVLVRAEAGARVADLRGALARYLALPVAALSGPRDGPLPDDAPLDDGRVRDGDVLTIGRAGAGDSAPARTLPDAPLELAVVGGPGAGRRIPLAEHETVTVGRDPASTLAIDDPSLSRVHARFTLDGAGVKVADAGSSNGTAVDGRRLAEGDRHTLSPEDQVEVGRSLLCVRSAAHADTAVTRRHGVIVEHNRPPRHAHHEPARRVDMPAPPGVTEGRRLPLAASIVPLVLGLVLFVFLHQVIMLAFMALTPVMAVSSYISDRRGDRRDRATRLAAFHLRAQALPDELAELRAAEIEDRRAAAPDAGEIVARAVRHLPALWERRRFDEDFLRLRLGTADQDARFEVAFEDGGKPAERVPVMAVIERQSLLAAVPLCADVASAAAVGLCGDPERVDGLARWLTVQAAVLHSPRELLVFGALSRERMPAWDWLTWLPHAVPTRTVVDHANIAVGEAASTALLRALAATIAVRREEHAQRFVGRSRRRPFLLVVLDEDVAPPRALVDDLLGDAPENDLAVLWLGRDQHALPGGCRVVAALDPVRAAMEVRWPGEGRRIADVTPDGLEHDVAEAAARALAPVRDVTASASSASIPRSASLLDVIDLAGIDADAVAQRWHDAGPAALVAPLGRSGEGTFSVDLRRDGPHGLVGGTTGAGKSELLQTLVAGLALSRPPDRLTFLFVDYKGGTAFQAYRNLPHAVGMVTDLDAHLTRRALVSLNAELRRRETVLRDAQAKDLLDLERRDPAGTPASLVIVIDEFAALRAEVPEFVDGVIDIAQRGRSLGIHVVLATQRPAGVVSDSIRANTNLRIALRVQQPGESEDVIDDPGAARISKALPGRALARTGHGELTEFQSAYVGGRTLPPTDTGHVVVSDLRLDEVGDGTGGDDGEGPTDLQRIVAAISEATARAGIAAPSPPWLEQLGDVIGLDALSQPDGPAAAVALGIVDEPARQRQTEWGIDLERDGSVLVFGTGATGKTTLLRTVAVALARRGDPRELHLYGLDFAGHGLSALEALPHVGSVIGEEDEERVTRLLTTLRREIDVRGRLLAAHGVSTLSALHAVLPAGERPPRIVVLLDSYPGFLAAFDTMAGGTLTSLLPRIIGDGRAAGIHVIATADRRIGVPSAVHAVVTQRIVLRLTDDDEYASFGLDRRATEGAHLPAGRGFVASSLEVQTAIVGGATGEAAAAALAAESAALTARWGDARAPAIAGMPVDVRRSGLPPSPEPARPVIGIEERDLGPAALDLREASVLVAGPYRSGRTTALRTIVAAVADAGGGVDVHVLAPRRSTLADLPGLATVARGAEACAARAAELAELVQARSPDADHPLVLVVVDDGGELAEGLAAPALETIARRGRDVGVRLVVACESQQARGFAAWLRELRKDGHGVLLDPNLDLDGDLLGVRLPRRTSAGFPPGRGYLVAEGVAVLVQLARDAAN